jgi:hypothetical protein
MPIVRHSSARWRTVIVRFSKSTADHGRPRSSEARNPVKIAVTISGRNRPVAVASSCCTCSLLGISTPTSSFFTSRRLVSTLTGKAAFCAASPRRCASDRIALRTASTLRARLRLSGFL